MRVAKIACSRCGSKSLREDGGQIRCAQCGRNVMEKGVPVAVAPMVKRPSAKWEL